MIKNNKVEFLFSHFQILINIEITFKTKYNFVVSSYYKSKKQLGSKDRKFLNILVYNYCRYKLSFKTVENDTPFKIFLLNYKMCEEVLKKSDTFNYILKEFNEFLRKNTDLSIYINQVFNEISDIINDFNRNSFPFLLQNEINLIDINLYPILNKKPPISLRSFYEKQGTIAIEKSLDEIDISYSKNDLGLLEIESLSNFENHLNIKKVEFEIQDNGSFIISKFISELKSNSILDACAGSGGKALAISYFDPSISIDIYDSEKKRLLEFNNRSQGKHKNINVLKELNANKKYDLVLIDAPCSGSGTIRRNPDKRFTITEDIINEFNITQNSIINNYSEYVDDNGLLIYVTCSLFAKENIEVVNEFLNNNSKFVPYNINKSILDNYSIKITNFANILIPINYNGDIFFIAVLQRISEKKDN